MEIKEGVKLLGYNWAAKVTETEQIIVSHCCSWLDELSALEAEGCASLCFVWWWWWCPPCTWCHRGVCAASAGAPMEAVSIRGQSYSGQWGGPGVCFLPFLTLTSAVVPCLFHSPQKCLDRLSFWRMLFWNTAYDVIYCVIFLQQRLLFPLRSTTFWTVWQGRNELLVCFFSAMNFFKDIFLTHQCHRFIKMEGKKVPLWTFGILNLFRWRSTFILYWIYVSHML